MSTDLLERRREAECRLKKAVQEWNRWTGFDLQTTLILRREIDSAQAELKAIEARLV